MSFVKKNPGDTVLELGGGDNPVPESDVRVDVRPGRYTNFTMNFNNSEWPEIGDSGFEVVVSRYCLEHIKFRNVPNFLRQCFRILKPGGRLYLTIPNTRAQMAWILEHPQGWDEKDFFTSASELLFGSQDYDENAHCAYFDSEVISTLLKEAGFGHLMVSAHGERHTDLLVEAHKPATTELAEGGGVSRIVTETPTAPPSTPSPSPLTRREMFDRHYFQGGVKVGGYAREGLWDFPVHWVTHQHILARKPESVLELGCARGYQVKRLQDAGIHANGLEISRHCWLTRVCDGIINFDICDDTRPWPYKDQSYDLCFSIALFEHIPEECLPWVVSEMKRVSKRALLGIDFGENDDGFDRTHVTLRDSGWWKEKLNSLSGDYLIDLADKELLEQGQVPTSVFQGDGKHKLNLGCGPFTMVHHGWANVDVCDASAFAQHYGYNFLRHDLRNGVPVNGSETIDLIAAYHMLEHFSYDEGLRLLKDCRRVIKPNGVMRISVPDANHLTEWYRKVDPLNLDRFNLDFYDELGENVAKANTPARKLYELLHAGHSAIYDYGTLFEQLEEAGWRSELSGFRWGFNDNDLTGQLIRETCEMGYELSIFANCYPITSASR